MRTTYRDIEIDLNDNGYDFITQDEDGVVMSKGVSVFPNTFNLEYVKNSIDDAFKRAEIYGVYGIMAF